MINPQPQLYKEETTQAITNLLSDVTMDALSSCSTKPGEIKSLIQHLQPYRELPSKDRRRRFMAGSIFGDEQVSQEVVSILGY